MKLIRTEQRFTGYCLTLFIAFAVLFVSFPSTVSAQKKPAPKKPAPAKPKPAATKPQAKPAANNRNAKAKPAPAKKLTPAQRRAEEARKKREEQRRQAALAEQRRREQAAREARARKLAFERGLKTESAANIINDVTSGEDLRLRQVAINALGDRAGTVVVMEAKTGRILTMVNQDWAIRHTFKPCSTIKLVTGVAGIQENLISNDGSIIGDSMRMTLDDALAYSNNVYFQRIGVKMGNQKMIDYARRLGLGARTGINAEGENPGRLPHNNSNARIYSHADDFAVTPLQLAVMVTAITNGGNRIVPQMNRVQTETVSFKSIYRDEIGLPYNNVQGVIPGMIGASEYGTARRGMNQSFGVAGKTGSCIGDGTWVGLFASVAPVEDPRYSVVVITRGETERGRIAAGIASQIYNAIGEQELRRDQNRFIALKNMRGTPASIQNNLETIAANNEADEDEDDDAAIAEVAEEKVIVIGQPESVPADRRLVTRTGQSAPLNQPAKPEQNEPFKDVIIPYKKDTPEKKEAPVKKGNTSQPTKAADSKPRPRVIKNN